MADHFVIDGSNLATEGRTEPSLAQLKEAVAAFHGEHPGAVATVVVDASFEHRIDPSERAAFAKTEAAGEVVSPPAGAVGRGDGFLLQIADRTGGTVLSNDSFQEFHAEYDWLFEPGRLIGAKPVPGVGWIFSLRRPVRGIVSRKTVQKAKLEAKADTKVKKAIAEATASALQPDAPKRRRRRGGRGRSSSGTTAPATRGNDKPEPEAVNEPAAFLRFVIDHRLGTEVSGTVDAFASHGAFVNVDGVRCYVPLSAMGNPQPNRARDVLTKDETRTFVVQAVDAPRRGIELGLPGYATVAGAPSEETVAAEVGRGRARSKGGAGEKAARKPAAKKAAAKATKGPAAARPELAPAPQPTEPPPRKRSRRGATESPAAEPVAAVAPPAKRSRGTKKKAAEQPAATAGTAKQPARKQPGRKQQPATSRTAKKKQPAKQLPAPSTAPAKKKAPARKTGAKQTAGTPAAAPATKATKATAKAAKASAKTASKKAKATASPAPATSKAARRRR
ncbi:MAG TPA: S1 RNA-binding domain-containing protein [Acidimicrobiia bacterium]